MNFVTRKYLSRRTMLRGMGVSIALPLLDSMVPAQTPLTKTAANSKSRLSCIYVPHGATMDKWTPATEGTGFELSEILQPLKPFRDRINIISDLSHPQAYGGGSATSNHNRSAATFLSGAHAELGPLVRDLDDLSAHARAGPMGSTAGTGSVQARRAGGQRALL